MKQDGAKSNCSNLLQLVTDRFARVIFFLVNDPYSKKKKKAIQKKLALTGSYWSTETARLLPTRRLRFLCGLRYASSTRLLAVILQVLRYLRYHSCYSKGASIVTIATTLTEEAGWPAVSRVANNSPASLVWLWVKGSLGQTFKAWEHCPNMRLLHRIYFILARDTWENMSFSR